MFWKRKSKSESMKKDAAKKRMMASMTAFQEKAPMEGSQVMMSNPVLKRSTVKPMTMEERMPERNQCMPENNMPEMIEGKVVMPLSKDAIIGACSKSESTVTELQPERLACSVQVPQEDIAMRAYEIWQQEGCPDGRAAEHWQMAIQEKMQS